MSRPGIEPGSPQPQCGILTTVRSRPKSSEKINIQNTHFLLSIYKHKIIYPILLTQSHLIHPEVSITLQNTNININKLTTI